MDMNCKQLKTLNVHINKIGRWTMWFVSYKWSNIKVIQKCKWLNGTHMISYAVFLLLYKVTFKNRSVSIKNLMIFNDNISQRFVTS